MVERAPVQARADRMTRYAQEKHRIQNTWREHWHFHVRQNVEMADQTPPFDPTDISCSCDNQPGRFRKRKPLDCGKSKCFTCHCDKLSDGKGGPFHKRYVADVDFAEQLAELDLAHA